MGAITDAVVYILAYKNQDRLNRLLKSIDECYPNKELECGNLSIIVVDNDEKGPMLEVPEGVSIFKGPGGGFTKGFNACLHHFMDNFNTTNNIPIILNDDLEIEPQCFEYMMAEMIENPNCGIVAPFQVDMKNPSMVICGGFGACYPSGQHKTGLRSDSKLVSQKSKWVTFCAVAINPRLVKEIGYLDRWMNMYYSDSDYSIRAVDAGFYLWIESKAVVRHENHGATQEFLGDDKGRRQLIFDKWIFENKWGERIISYSSTL